MAAILIYGGACKETAPLRKFEGRWVGDAAALKAKLPASAQTPELETKLQRLAKTTLTVTGRMIRFNGPSGDWEGALSSFATTSRSVAADIVGGRHKGKRCTLGRDAQGKLLFELEGEKGTFWIFRPDVL